MKKIALLIFLFGLLNGCDGGGEKPLTSADVHLKRFSSCEEIDQARSLGRNPETILDSSTKFEEASAAAAPGETNIQVQGVDELDTSKAQDEFIYHLVHGSGSLVVIRREPSDQVGILQTIPLEGTSALSGLFVTKDQVIVLGLGSRELDIKRPCYGFFGPPEIASSVIPTDGSELCPVIQPFTTLYYFKRNNNGTVELQAERKVDGTLRTARLIEDRLHLVQWNWLRLRYDTEEPGLPVEDILPTTEINSKKEKLASCTDIFHEPAMRDSGFSPPILSSLQCVMTFQIGRPESKPEGACIAVNDASVVYASEKNLFLASYGWRDKTPIHQFSLSEGNQKTEYVGSALVSGHLLNQFSMDEFEGHLRIATTGAPATSVPEDLCEPDPGEACHVIAEPVNQVLAFKLKRRGNPEFTGKSEDLAPGERIFAVRFMGKRGYVVTFRQRDPLFAMDLSDPGDIRVGEKPLKVDGFSRYLHPMNEDYLLGVGRAADENGRVKGMALSIFDVRDLDEPKLVHNIEIGDRNTSSEVERDHHAFRYVPEKNLVILPIRQYSNGTKLSFQIYEAEISKGFSLLGEASVAKHSYSGNRSFYRNGLISLLGGGEFILRSAAMPTVDLVRIPIQ